MVCMPHTLQCETLHFPKHKFPIECSNAVEINCTSESYAQPRWNYKSRDMEKESFITGAFGYTAEPSNKDQPLIFVLHRKSVLHGGQTVLVLKRCSFVRGSTALQWATPEVPWGPGCSYLSAPLYYLLQFSYCMSLMCEFSGHCDWLPTYDAS